MDEKKCMDCTYFAAYYLKKKGKFYKTPNGFCGNVKGNGHFRKTDKICSFFAPNDINAKKEQHIKYLNDYLAEVANKLNEIKQVLQTDE